KGLRLSVFVRGSKRRNSKPRLCQPRAGARHSWHSRDTPTSCHLILWRLRVGRATSVILRVTMYDQSVKCSPPHVRVVSSVQSRCVAGVLAARQVHKRRKTEKVFAL